MIFKETEKIEFKKSTSELKEGIISICAILNKKNSGKLYFGIKDNGEIIGQEIGKDTLRDIATEISRAIEPKVHPNIKKIILNKKECVLVEFKGISNLYFAYGRAYIRVSDQNQQLDVENIKERIISQNNIIWDKQTFDGTIKDINSTQLKKCITKANQKGKINFKFTNVKDVLNKLNLLNKSKLTNAGNVLFSKKANIELQCAVFKTKEKSEFIDINLKKGNIFELIEFSKKYLFEHLNWRADLTKTERVERLEIPERALFEAIINSFCHKDYTIIKSNEIAIYPDRVEIYNPGKFPKEYSIKEYLLGKGKSILRNPSIAQILYYFDYIENWGSGLKRINEYCNEQNVKVEYRIEPNGLSIIFYRPNVIKNVPVNVPVNEVVNRENLLLNLILKNNKIKIKDLSNNLDVTEKTIKRDLKKLKYEKKIKRIGSDKSGYWQVLKK